MWTRGPKQGYFCFNLSFSVYAGQTMPGILEQLPRLLGFKSYGYQMVHILFERGNRNIMFDCDWLFTRGNHKPKDLNHK